MIHVDGLDLPSVRCAVISTLFVLVSILVLLWTLMWESLLNVDGADAVDLYLLKLK